MRTQLSFWFCLFWCDPSTHLSHRDHSAWHDDVIKWKHFPRYWPFVRGIHRSRWIPRTKASDAELDVFFYLRANKRLSKQPRGWWFETPSWSLWRQCNGYGLGQLFVSHWLRQYPEWSLSPLCFTGIYHTDVTWAPRRPKLLTHRLLVSTACLD